MAYSSKRSLTKKRHEFVRQQFNKFMTPNEHGIHPDMDQVFMHMEQKIGYSAGYIKEILKSA